MGRVRNWESQHVVVTGGTKGIGLATVELLAARGAQVSVLARSATAEWAASLTCGSQRVGGYAVDVSDLASVEDAVAQARAACGPVTALITSAGVTRPGYFLDLESNEFRRQMDVNYFGTLHAIRATLPDMLSAGVGAVVCLSSSVALVGVFGYAAYAPTKYAVRGLCETLRAEVHSRGVSVAYMCPSDVDTPGLVEEIPLRPPELVAVSGTVRPVSTAAAARAVVNSLGSDGVRYVDGATRSLALINRLAPRLLQAVLDRRASGAAVSASGVSGA